MLNGYLFILSPDMPHTSDEFETKKIIVALLISGAHTDIVNYSGECPRVGYLKSNDTLYQYMYLIYCTVYLLLVIFRHVRPNKFTKKFEMLSCHCT